MTVRADELLDLAERVAGWARDGEQVEAYVARTPATPTSRVYDGDVESLSSAETEGVGVRVIADSRQGFAYAGSLDETSLRETLADARDNAAFGTVDEFLGLPEPDGVAPADLDLFRDGAGRRSHRRARSSSPSSSSGPCVPPTPASAASRRRSTATRRSRPPIASSTGVRAYARRTDLLALRVRHRRRGRGDPDRLRLVDRPRTRRPRRRAGPPAMAAERATRLLGATKPASRRVTVVLDPMVTASFLGVLSGALSGESVLKGRSMFADRVGEQVAVAGLTLIDDPTDPEARGAGRYDAEGLATRRNVLIENGVLQGFLHNTYTGRRVGHGVDRLGGARRLQDHARRRHPGAGARTRRRARQQELLADIGDGLLVHVGAGPALGRQPGERRLLRRLRGAHGPRRRAGRARARGHHRVDAAAHAARRRGRRLRPRVAAGRRRGVDPRHPRRHPQRRLTSANSASARNGRP